MQKTTSMSIMNEITLIVEAYNRKHYGDIYRQDRLAAEALEKIRRLV